MRKNLIHRGIEVEEICLSCKSYPEDVTHTFWYCRFARKVRRNSEIWPRLSGFKGGEFGDLFQWIVDQSSKEELETFVLIYWSLWTERNLILFQSKGKDWTYGIARPKRTKEHYSIFREFQIDGGLHTNPLLLWKPSHVGAFKVNVDAAVT